MQGPRSPPSCLVTPALQTISGMVSCRGHSSPRQSEVRRPPRTTYGSLAGCVPSPTCPFKHKHHLTLPLSRFKCTDLPCPPLALSGRLRALSHMPLPSTNTPRSNHPQGLSAQASPAHLWLLGRLRALTHVPLQTSPHPPIQPPSRPTHRGLPCPPLAPRAAACPRPCAPHSPPPRACGMQGGSTAWSAGRVPHPRHTLPQSTQRTGCTLPPLPPQSCQTDLTATSSQSITGPSHPPTEHAAHLATHAHHPPSTMGGTHAPSLED